MGAGQSASDMAASKRAQARKLEEEAKNWDQGAAGERQVGAILDRLPDDYVVFHDLGIPGSAANVDHLVVGPGGVFAIDSKNFSYPLTLGRGRGADKIWTGGRPVDLKPCRWEASEVERLIGVPARPMLCVIAPSLPESMFDFDGVCVCQPDAVVGVLTSASPIGLDVARISERVASAFRAEPRVRKADAPSLRAPGGSQERNMKHRPSRRSFRIGARTVVGLFQQPLFHLLLFAVVMLAAMKLLPLLTTDAARIVTDWMVRDLVPTTVPEDDPATTFSAPLSTGLFTPPPPVLIETSCPNPGMGWTVSFGWPGDLPAGASAYSIRWQLDGGPIIRHDFGGWTDPTSSPVDMRIPNGSEQRFFTDYLGDEGQILASTQQLFESPADC